MKQPVKTSSATILFKTSSLKFYDKGFVKYYDDYINLNILNAGNSVFDINIYKNKVCQSTLKCVSTNNFNNQYLNPSYKDTFLYDLFLQKKIYFRDKKNNIFIKVIPD